MVNGLSNVFFGLVVGGGLALSPVILDLLGDDWRGTLRIFGFYYVGLLVIWTIMGRDRVTEEFSIGSSQPILPLVRTALGYRDLWVCGAGFAGATMAFSAYIAFYPTLMLEEYEISLRVSGLALALDVVLGGASAGWPSAITPLPGGRRASSCKSWGSSWSAPFWG